MIKPTSGRVVLFTPSKHDDALRFDGSTQKLAAIVAYVHSDDCINLAVFDSNGGSAARCSVPLVHGDVPEALLENGYYAEWMPYQKGQAAKTEAVEKALADATPARPAHEQRVIDEKAQLDDRLVKLVAFFGTPIYAGLQEEEKFRLQVQSDAMETYSDVLGARIAAFSSGHRPDPAAGAPRPLGHNPVA
ncbi:hypothetical protein [Burkholderia sp. Ax-1719]|uniref:crAss001_48 related protein n=1 Tax=Burkholderia sp. Ax-1719 TaxID=2608334 RepID=UPI0014248A45|nr:hypothetical protein [Burkholderia sp. Ax-1719]NIE67459.1 hypothetical protein [Burkholderia sp. Ax-1719]